jgi:hypothetical protein
VSPCRPAILTAALVAVLVLAGCQSKTAAKSSSVASPSAAPSISYVPAGQWPANSPSVPLPAPSIVAASAAAQSVPPISSPAGPAATSLVAQAPAAGPGNRSACAIVTPAIARSVSAVYAGAGQPLGINQCGYQDQRFPATDLNNQLFFRYDPTATLALVYANTKATAGITIEQLVPALGPDAFCDFSTGATISGNDVEWAQGGVLYDLEVAHSPPQPNGCTALIAAAERVYRGP